MGVSSGMINLSTNNGFRIQQAMMIIIYERLLIVDLNYRGVLMCFLTKKRRIQSLSN